LLVSCGGEESKTIHRNSSKFSSLSEKRNFLERYVNFRRSYEQLEFDISYIDGGDGGFSSPTEWDIRILAKVPTANIKDWISGMTKKKKTVDTSWVSSIPCQPARDIAPRRSQPDAAHPPESRRRSRFDVRSRPAARERR